jgi:hypothetical protein
MQSEAIDKLALALSKAQAHIDGAKKDSVNPHFRSNYADLASVWDACHKHLSDNGIAVVQTTNVVDGQVLLKTMLIHSSGQWIAGLYPVNAVADTPQALKSALTYARRAGLESIAGVCPIEDDGNAANGTISQPQPKKDLPQHPPVPTREEIVAHAVKMPNPVAKPSANPNNFVRDAGQKKPDQKNGAAPFTKITEKQAGRLFAIAKSKGMSRDILFAYLKGTLGNENVYDIHPEKYEGICAHVDKYVAGPSQQAIDDLTPPDFMNQDDGWDKL